jgi:MoxR-like ATPase
MRHGSRLKAVMTENAMNLSDGHCGFSSVEHVRQAFLREGFVCSLEAATTLFLTQRLEKPLLVEGPAGVGKTEIAKTAARVLGLPLIRLQCYEGLDESKALYEWQYGKQLLYSQMLKDHVDTLLDGCRDLQQSMARLHAVKDLFFSESFLEPRPLLQALRAEQGAVLLIDEVDKADEEFEAFLLEVLSDFQVSIPELGTVQATRRPFVVLTSNSTRELGEALKRRCLYLYVDFPSPELEREIVQTRVPELPAQLVSRLVAFIQRVRRLALRKAPSVSETLDWAKVLLVLNTGTLDREFVTRTLNVFLKHEEDLRTVTPLVPELLAAGRGEGA